MSPGKENDNKTMVLSDLVHTLEEDILFGRLRPRERLVEDELISRFKAKRHTVRAALDELSKMRLVIRRPNRGCIVADLSSGEAEQIYMMRALLQEHAARMIPPNEYQNLADRLKKIQHTHSTYAQRGDLTAVLKINKVFHDTLYGACGNDFLFEDIKRYSDLTHLVRSYAIGNTELLENSIKEHLSMIQALEQSNTDLLVNLCVEHLWSAYKAYKYAHGSWEAHGGQ